MLITKQIGIDMGHRVPNHKSKCRNFHGHRYTIEAGVDDKLVTTKGDSAEGMVIDFADLKKAMMLIDARFDHGFCISTEDSYHDTFIDFSFKDNMKVISVDFIPTAENLSKHWAGIIKAELDTKGIKLKYLKVWETPTSTATFIVK